MRGSRNLFVVHGAVSQRGSWRSCTKRGMKGKMRKTRGGTSVSNRLCSGTKSVVVGARERVNEGG